MKNPRLQISILILALALGAVTGCTKEAKKNRFLQRGNQAFTKGEYQKAEIEYLNVVKVAGLNPVAVRQLGLIYSEQGRLLQAFSYLQKASELEPENADVHLKLGLAFLALRKQKEAGEQALLVIAKQPGHEEALLLLAQSVDKPKEIQVLQQRIEKMRQQDKDRASYHLALATLYLRQQDKAKAEDECKNALLLEPKSAAANIALGNLYWLKNEVKQAEPLLKTGSELAPLRSSRRLTYADFKLKTDAVAEAKKILEDVARQAPDYVPVWSYLMEVAFLERRFDDCATLNKKVLALDPINYDGLLKSGKLNLIQNEPDKAIAVFQRMTPIYDTVPQLHYQFALAYLEKGDAAKAVSSLSRALVLDPGFTDATLLLAELNIRQGNAVVAIPSLLQLLKLQPRVAKAHLLLAAAYSSQKNLDDAAAVYQRMMPLFATNRVVPFLLGDILLKQSKYSEARTAFEKSLVLSPGYYPAVEQLVILDLGDKQFGSALDRVKSQIAKTPVAGEPWILLANVHRAQRKSAEAEADLLKAIELDPNLQSAYMLLAQIYVDSNRQHEALEKLKAFVVKNPKDQATLMQIGMLQEGMTNYPAARDTYEKLISLNPNFSAALNNLAYLYSEHFDRLDKAVDMAERARKLLPDDPSIADTLGWLLYKKGDYSKAIALLQESAANPKLSSNPEVQFHLGMTQYMLGEEPLARIYLQRAVESPVDFSGKEEGRRRLVFLAIDPKTANATVIKELEKRQRNEPDDPVVLSRLAAIYERDGNADKAVKTYEDVRKKNPQNVPVMMKLAKYYSIQANTSAKALDMVNEAHRLAPDDSAITYELARKVYNSRDYKRASSLFQESARKFPNDPNVLYDLALSYYSLGRVPEAEESGKNALHGTGTFARADDAKRFLSMIDFYNHPNKAAGAASEVQQILKADPNYVPAAMVSAALQKQRGNMKEAIQVYETILARNPLFSPALREVVLLYADLPGDDQKAYSLAAKTREAYPADPDVAKAVGILAYRRADYKRTTQLLNESARKRVDDAEIFYYLGMAHFRLKENKESKVALQRALTLNVQTKFAAEAKRVIAELK